MPCRASRWEDGGHFMRPVTHPGLRVCCPLIPEGQAEGIRSRFGSLVLPTPTAWFPTKWPRVRELGRHSDPPPTKSPREQTAEPHAYTAFARQGPLGLRVSQGELGLGRGPGG